MDSVFAWHAGNKKMDKDRILALVYEQMADRTGTPSRGTGIQARSINKLDMSTQRSTVFQTPLADDHCEAQKETLAHRKPLSHHQAQTIAETRMSEDGSPTLPEYLTKRKAAERINPP